MASSTSDDQENWGARCWELISAMRARSPLIQCITNLVSMDLMANVLLAGGASPAMVHALPEIEDFTPHADALLINIGTLSDAWLPSMTSAAVTSSLTGRPWILDPVAAYVSEFRMAACLSLLKLKPTVIRGNASEIIALSSASRLQGGKGADSSHGSEEAVDAAKDLARSSGAVVAVTGAVDLVTDGRRVVEISNGVPLLQKITATGCAVTALVAAFVAVAPLRAVDATACALSVFGLAGELAMQVSKGPGSLRVNLLDSLHGMDEQTVISGANIRYRARAGLVSKTNLSHEEKEE
ncbi:hydroxyethylthiazole kinase family protein [Wolffia australiana]